MSGKLPIFIADAFTCEAFSGNSAAVCLIPPNVEVPKRTRQKIAAEMNLSETAFVEIEKYDNKSKLDKEIFKTERNFKLSWFTPVCEVPLCGHATLATSAVLFYACGNTNGLLEYETASGILKAKKWEDNRIEIDLPAYDSTPVPEKYFKVVKATVGDLPVTEVVLSESKKLLVRLDDKVSRKQFEEFRPNPEVLMSKANDIVGVIVTIKGTGKADCVDEKGRNYDFVSRYFAPWMGVAEDPVTGSAHSVLAPYWSKILNKKDFYARQCSSRGGDLLVEYSLDRVFLRGHCTVVLKGEIKF